MTHYFYVLYINSRGEIAVAAGPSKYDKLVQHIIAVSLVPALFMIVVSIVSKNRLMKSHPFIPTVANMEHTQPFFYIGFYYFIGIHFHEKLIIVQTRLRLHLWQRIRQGDAKIAATFDQP